MNERVIRWMGISVALLTTVLLIVACGATPEPTATTEPTKAPATPVAVAPTDTPSSSTTADPATGQQLWSGKPCSGCHGADAKGDIGPKLANTDLSFDEMLQRVRNGVGSMPAFDAEQISDEEMHQMKHDRSELKDVLYARLQAE